MKTYVVQTACRVAGQWREVGVTVDMAPKAAKYWLLNGVLAEQAEIEASEADAAETSEEATR